MSSKLANFTLKFEYVDSITQAKKRTQYRPMKQYKVNK